MKLTILSLFFFLCSLSLLSTQCKEHSTELKIPSKDDASRFQEFYSSYKDTALVFSARQITLDSALSIARRGSQDSLITLALQTKSKLYRSMGDFQKAVDWTDTLYQYAFENNDDVLMAQAKFNQGYNHLKMEDYILAYVAYQDAQALYLRLNDSLMLSKLYLNLAVLEKEFGDLKGSEATAIKSLEFGGANLSNTTIVGIYNNLASTSKDLGDFEEALYYNNKAKDISENPKFDIILKGNRYNVYLSQGNYKKASEELKEYLKDSLLNTSGQRKEYLRQLDHYGEALSHLQSPLAETQLLSALNGRIALEDESGVFYSHIHLADHYYRTKNITKSRDYANAALELAKKSGSADREMEALSNLIKVKESPRQEAMRYQILKDSLTDITIQNKDAFAKIKYDSKKNREDNLVLRATAAEKELALSKATNRSIWFGGSILALIGFGIVYYRYSTERHKRERLKATYDTETKISKRVHDELANDMYHIMTKIQEDSQLSPSSQEGYLDALELIYERTRDISRETSYINTSHFAIELSELLVRYKTNTQNIITKGLTEQLWQPVSSEKKITLYRVLQELLTNFKKHSKANLCTVVFIDTPRHIEILYTDNGVGIAHNKGLQKNGLQNAENRMDAINGALTFETSKEQGLKIKLTIPK